MPRGIDRKVTITVEACYDIANKTPIHTQSSYSVYNFHGSNLTRNNVMNILLQIIKDVVPLFIKY